MNPHNDTQHDDAEFEAFLRGEGKLADALRELPQPAPSKALTDAILAQAEADLPPKSPANDGAMPDAGPRPAPHFLRRARVPLAIAASFALGLSLTMQWIGQPSPEQQAINEAAAPTVPAPVAPPPAVPPAMQQADAPRLRSSEPASQPAPQPAPQPADFAVPAPPEDKPRLAMPAPAPIALPPPPPPAPEPAPMAAPVATRAAAPIAAPIAAPAPAPAAKVAPEADEQAKQQLILIEELLKADLPRDALEQWKAFRQAYPRYPVPEPLAARMKALEEQ
jgi:hypothetical protein